MLQIIHVRTETEAGEVRLLVADYIDWLRIRYPDESKMIDAYLAAQDVAGQMRDLLTRFAPPSADCLLARLDGVAVGVVMTKRYSDTICEMNRMYVRDAARGHGVGRALVAELLATGKALGYQQMMLAAGPRHTEALPLYRNFGFADAPDLADTGAGDTEVRLIRDL
jgi:GNAT superfamily N-acetyltransferase